MSDKLNMSDRLDELGCKLAHIFHVAALFVLGGTIIWSSVHAYIEMMAQGAASLKDILLLFIYLELGAMVGIYFRTHLLPVRFLLYVAITALTRALTVDMKTMDSWTVLGVTGAILILTLSALVLQFTSQKYGDKDEAGTDDGINRESEPNPLSGK